VDPPRRRKWINPKAPPKPEDRVRDRGALGAAVGAGKQVVLPRQRRDETRDGAELVEFALAIMRGKNVC
jgi:hypothetical protein